MKKNAEDALDLRTCDALLLQFKEPIAPDFPEFVIPSARDIEELVYIAGEILSGREVNPLDVDNLYGAYEHRVSSKQFSLLPERVREGIPAAFDRAHCDAASTMDIYLSGLCGRVESRWVYLFGDSYGFVEGGRREAQERVRKFFDREELAGFEKVGQLFLPYVKRLHVPAKVVASA